MNRQRATGETNQRISSSSTSNINISLVFKQYHTNRQPNDSCLIDWIWTIPIFWNAIIVRLFLSATRSILGSHFWHFLFRSVSHCLSPFWYSQSLVCSPHSEYNNFCFTSLNSFLRIGIWKYICRIICVCFLFYWMICMNTKLLDSNHTNQQSMHSFFYELDMTRVGFAWIC